MRARWRLPVRCAVQWSRNWKRGISNLENMLLQRIGTIPQGIFKRTCLDLFEGFKVTPFKKKPLFVFQRGYDWLSFFGFWDHPLGISRSSRKLRGRFGLLDRPKIADALRLRGCLNFLRMSLVWMNEFYWLDSREKTKTITQTIMCM